jgi:hypothetical protein
MPVRTARILRHGGVFRFPGVLCPASEQCSLLHCGTCANHENIDHSDTVANYHRVRADESDTHDHSYDRTHGRTQGDEHYDRAFGDEHYDDILHRGSA